MRPKDRAKFIISVAEGNAPDSPKEEIVICPRCGAVNKTTSNFCKQCGFHLAEMSQSNDVPSVSTEPSTTDAPAGNKPVGNDSGVEAVKDSKVVEKEPSAVSDGPFRSLSDSDDGVVGQTAFDSADDGAAKVALNKVEEGVPREASADQTTDDLILAKGLPSWDVVPPNVVVRRKGRK